MSVSTFPTDPDRPGPGGGHADAPFARRLAPVERQTVSLSPHQVATTDLGTQAQPRTVGGAPPTAWVGGEPPTARREPADRRRPLGLWESRLRRVAMYPVLIVMAGADAYGFWNTLTKIIQRDTSLVLVFVVALAFGSVAVAHEVGRLVRARREGYGGNVAWIALLAVLWLALGSAIAWLRAHDSVAAPTAASGELAGMAVPVGGGGSVQLALLLLGLYLLTGALAMTHAYRFGDPRTAEVRRAQRRRARLAAKLAEQQYRLRLAQGRYAVRQEDRKRERTQRDNEQEMAAAWQEQLRAEARQQAAFHQKDPAATDALIDRPDNPNNHRRNS